MNTKSKLRIEARFRRFFSYTTNLLSLELPPKFVDNTIKFCLWLIKTITGIVSFIFLYYLFVKLMLPRLGFEATLLVAMVSIILSLKGLNDKLDDD